MTARSTRRALLATVATGAAFSFLLAGCAAGSGTDGGPVEISFLVNTGDASVAVAEALADAYMAEHEGVTVNVETRPGGSEGDNFVKTQLATGTMSDVFLYNAGSLFQALNPDDTLVDLSDEPFQDRVLDSFKPTVSGENGIYGGPIGGAMGGGIFYNKKVYADLGLEIPTTWDEFMANNAAIKEAGIAPVIQTFADTWTSQLFVLGDFYNVLAEDPEWAEKYTNNEAKYADDEFARAGFEHQQEVFEAGYLNEDFASATYADGVRKVAQGEGAHYPMLTFAVNDLTATYPDLVNEVGFFAMPGEGDANGLTTWMPAGLYIPKSSDNVETAKDFIDFVVSVEGCEIQTESQGVSGPYLVEGCTLPEDAPQPVLDMLPYFEREDGTAPALEYLSPIKGPALEQITVEVGSGIRSAEDGAALYDEDVIKQAKQLGLEGW